MPNPRDTEEASYHRKLLLEMSDPPNRRDSSCFSSPEQDDITAALTITLTTELDRTYSILTRTGRRPTQTSHPGGLEVHIKMDYRVDEASANLNSRHTTHYF